MTNREIAEQIVRDWPEGMGCSEYFVDAIIAALNAKLPPPGHILTDDGTVREVCSEDTSHTGYTTIVLCPAEAARANP